MKSLAEQFLPNFLLGRHGDLFLWQWLGLPVLLLVATLIAWVLYRIGVALLSRASAHTQASWDELLLSILKRPGGVFLGVLIAYGLLRLLSLPQGAQLAIDVASQTLLITTAVFALVGLVDFLADRLRQSLIESQSDELKVRGVRTQVIVIRRIAKIVVYVFGLSLVLVQFEAVRRVGVSLLASAGIAGVVLGLAAQRSLASILAGIQLAITQPVRIGDSVVIENEVGVVEEINLTYVVVRVWDLRRLIVPMARFLEQPFQNWTKVSPALLGTVNLFTDYTAPVQLLRQELTRFVQAHSQWDKSACALQVTEADQSSLTLRMLVSAKDAGTLFGLRCDVREHMISFLQSLEGGRYLPKRRLENMEGQQQGSAHKPQDTHQQ